MMSGDGKFLGLTQILDGSKNLAIYVSDFVTYVLDQFWDENFYKILK